MPNNLVFTPGAGFTHLVYTSHALQHLKLVSFDMNQNRSDLLQNFTRWEVSTFVKSDSLVGKTRPFLSASLTNQEPLPKDSPPVTIDACQTT